MKRTTLLITTNREHFTKIYSQAKAHPIQVMMPLLTSQKLMSKKFVC